MDHAIMRFIAGGLAVGLTLGAPGVPVAFAQVEITPEIRQACEAFEPALRDIALTEVVPKLEESTRPDASPEAKAEAQQIERTASTIHRTATETVSKMAVPDRATLEQTLTQRGGVTAPVAQEVAQKAQAAMQEAKSAFASGDPMKAEAVLKSFQEECRTRYQMDPSVLSRSSGDSRTITFDRVAFDNRTTDFIGNATECHLAGETLRQSGVEFTGAPPSAEEAKKMIEGMNVSADEKSKMLEMAKAYEGFTRDGNFAGIHEMQARAAQEAYRQVMESGVMPGGTAMTPEMAQRMATEMHAMSPTGTYKEWAAVNPDMAAAHPEYATMATMNENMRTMEAAMAAGTPTHEVMEQMMHNETMVREYTTYTSDAPRTETSGTSVTTYEDRYPDGHALCPAGKSHVGGVADGTPEHCV